MVKVIFLKRAKISASKCSKPQGKVPAFDSWLFWHLKFLSPLKALPSLELVVRYQGYFFQAISQTTTL